jgi:hypothetical protein
MDHLRRLTQLARARFVAAELYRRGLADKVLVSQISDHATLLKLGVPPNALENFGTANKNTKDEAVALKEWAKQNAASVFIIPSEIFTARRVRWKTEYGVTAFQTELLKYAYYRLNY